MSSEESGRAPRLWARWMGAWHLSDRRARARPMGARPGRTRAARVAFVLLVAGIGAVPLGAGASPAVATDDAAAILAQVNQARAAVGAPPLRLSSAMSAVATAWSTHLADTGTCPGGLAHNPSFSTQIPRGWRLAGENVACNTTPDALGLETQWMNSPPHRANILNPAYTDIGIGIVIRGRTAWGTQDFGAYSSAPAPEPAPVPAAAAPAPPLTASPAPPPTPTPSPAPTTAPTPTATPFLASVPDVRPDSVPVAGATGASSPVTRSTPGGAGSAGLLGVVGSLTLGVLAVAGHRRKRT